MVLVKPPHVEVLAGQVVVDSKDVGEAPLMPKVLTKALLV
jgi:hypothetical protein